MWFFLALVIALIPASIAYKKGRSFILWYLYGFFLWIVALIHSILISDESNEPVNVEPVYSNVKEVKYANVDINAKVRIQEWNLEKDSHENIFLKIRVLNTTQKEVSALNIKIKGYDSFNNLISINNDESFSVLVQDLQLLAGSSQMIENRIILPDSNIRKVELFVQQICYKNNEIENFNEPCFVETCQECMGAQYLPYAKRITEQAGYYMIEQPKYWQCICGEVNTEDTCLSCGISKSDARRFSKENAELTYEEYLKQEEKEREEKEAYRLAKEERKKQCIEKYKGMIPAVALVAVVVVVALVVYNVKVIKPKNTYNEAMALLESGKYDAADKLLDSISDYKDVKTVKEQVKYESYVYECVSDWKSWLKNPDSFTLYAVAFYSDKESHGLYSRLSLKGEVNYSYPAVIFRSGAENNLGGNTTSYELFYYVKDKGYSCMGSCDSLDEDDYYDSDGKVKDGEDGAMEVMLCKEINELIEKAESVGSVDMDRVKAIIKKDAYSSIKIIE